MSESRTRRILSAVAQIPILLVSYVGALAAWAIAMVLGVSLVWLVFVAIGWLSGHRGV